MRLSIDFKFSCRQYEEFNLMCLDSITRNEIKNVVLETQIDIFVLSSKKVFSFQEGYIFITIKS